ncbi:MAG: arsenite methyltransferase [Thermomicrobiales bacterium]|nr:arsenite methyltransferase [Thermomicrobiales bacterium]
MNQPDQQTLEAVRDRYASAATKVLTLTQSSGCGPGCCSTNTDPITGGLYGDDQIAEVATGALEASLGCGNPTALAELKQGEVVLDLGSGGGIDVLLSAKRVGPTGHAYGVDMTDEMLALAERNRAAQGVDNVTFLKGRIEDIPLPARHVDVVISNCVINLAVDKAPVLREAFRVLKPGGRFAVSDVVSQGHLPDDLRNDMEAWIGCIAGALEENEFRSLLTEVGFENIGIQVTREYDPRELAGAASGEQACCSGGRGAPVAWDGSAWDRFEGSGGKMVSAFVRATKPE